MRGEQVDLSSVFLGPKDFEDLRWSPA